MAVTPDLDRDSVAAGAAVGLGVAVVVILAVQVADVFVDVLDTDWVFVPYLAVLGGWVAAGMVAARRRPDAPFTHGMLAAFVSFLPVAVFGLVVDAVRGDDVAGAVMVTNAILAATAGVVGGLVAGRRR